MYNPLVGGIPMIDVDGDGEVDTVQTKEEGGTSGPKSSGRPVGRPKGTTGIPRTVNAEEELYSRKDIQNIVYKIEDLEKHIQKSFAEKINKEELSESQKVICQELTRSIVLGKEKNQWKKTANLCIKDFDKIEKLSTIDQVMDISQNSQLEAYPAALLYHSKKK